MMRILLPLLLAAGAARMGWCAEPAAASWLDHPFAEQIALHQRIASASFDCLLDEADAEDVAKPHHLANAHLAIKGSKYSCSFSEVRAHGAALFNCQIARNATHWQYLDATRTLNLRLCTAWRAWGTPFNLPFPCPMPLSPFRALTYAKGIAIEDARLAWSDISSPAWLADCSAASIDRITAQSDGSAIIHCPIGESEITADHALAIVQHGGEVRIIVRPYPEYGGRHLIAELQWGCIQDPTVFDQEEITYRGVVAADGSGIYPIPVEDVRYLAMTHTPLSRRIITACTINAPIADDAFDIDPTLATRLVDLSTDFAVPLSQPRDAQPGKR